MANQIIYPDLKVLHLSSEKGWRGGEQQIAYLIEELEKYGISNRVACQENSEFEKVCHIKGWEYFTLNFRSSLNIYTAYRIALYCKKHKVDIVHLHTGKSHSTGVISTIFGHHSKMVLTRRVDFAIRNNLFTLWKYNHPGINKIIAVSDAINRILRPVLRNPDKCVTVHSGIDVKKFQADSGKNFLREHYQVPPDHFLIGNTSALADHKDYFTFIDTCKWLVEQNVRAKFFIIGDGPEKEKIKSYIQQNDLTGHIIMTGFIEDIVSALFSLDIFLMTSKTEGLGTSILDAFACRIPVVATRAGGIPEMVMDGKTGLLADIRDYKALGAHILHLIRTEELKLKLTENAYQYLLNNFTTQAMAEKVRNIYTEIMT